MKSAAAILVFTLSALPAIADAEPDEERAKLFFDAGNIAYRKGRYQEAIEAFEEAFQVFPQPEIAFSLAQALRRQFAAIGDASLAERSIFHYREYLQRAPEGRRRPEAVEQIELLSRSLRSIATSSIAGAPRQAVPTELMVFSEIDGARASIDGRPLEALTLTARVEPGQRTVRAEADGYRAAELKVLAIEGQKTAVKIELVEKPGLLQVVATEGAAIFVDGVEVGEAPLQSAVPLAPGDHRLVVSAAGHYPFIASVPLERDRLHSLEIALDTSAQRTIAYGTAIAVGATLIASVIATGLALHWQTEALSLDAQRRVENVPTDTIEALNRAIDQRNTARVIAGAGWGTTLLLAAVGAVLYFGDDGLPASERLTFAR